MPIHQTLQSHIQAALASLGVAEVQPAWLQLQPTKPEFEGDLTLVCFPFAKGAGKNPEQVGHAIGEYLLAHCVLVDRFNVVKGFLNLVITDAAWLAELEALNARNATDGLPPRGEKVLVEFSSPNTNKPLHLGHLRNNFLGASLAGLLQFAGFDTKKANLVNDRGIHICKSMVAYLETGKGETPESSGMKGDHLVGKYYVEYDRLLKAQVAELQAEGVEKEEAERRAPIAQKARQMLVDWEGGDAAVLALWKK